MRLFWFVFAALVLAACDSGTEVRPPELGTFEAEVRGGVTRDLSGSAGYIDSPREAGTGLFVSLTDRSRRSIAISDPSGVLAEVGTYAIDGSFIGLTYFDRLGDIAGALRAVDGTVRVTRAADDQIEATVTARLAAGVDRDPTSTLTATFEARRVAAPR